MTHQFERSHGDLQSNTGNLWRIVNIGMPLITSMSHFNLFQVLWFSFACKPEITVIGMCPQNYSIPQLFENVDFYPGSTHVYYQRILKDMEQSFFSASEEGCFHYLETH